MTYLGQDIGRKDHQARSQDFVQEGANLARAQGTPYQKPKTPRIWPTIFWGGANSFFIFFYFYYKILSYFSAQGGGGGMAPWPPLATSLQDAILFEIEREAR